MNRKKIAESETTASTQLSAKIFLRIGNTPLAFIMRNPKVTPVILLVLAVALVSVGRFLSGAEGSLPVNKVRGQSLIVLRKMEERSLFRYSHV